MASQPATSNCAVTGTPHAQTHLGRSAGSAKHFGPCMRRDTCLKAEIAGPLGHYKVRSTRRSFCGCGTYPRITYCHTHPGPCIQDITGDRFVCKFTCNQQRLLPPKNGSGGCALCVARPFLRVAVWVARRVWSPTVVVGRSGCTRRWAGPTWRRCWSGWSSR